MKFCPVFLFALAVFVLGCNQEPETPREQAEQAQEELEEAREEAAEAVAEAEEDAVDTVADAREEARADLREAKREAAEKVEDAEQELKAQLDQLSDPGFVKEAPAARQEQDEPIVLPKESDAQEPPKVRVEIDTEQKSSPE